MGSDVSLKGSKVAGAKNWPPTQSSTESPNIPDVPFLNLYSRSPNEHKQPASDTAIHRAIRVALTFPTCLWGIPKKRRSAKAIMHLFCFHKLNKGKSKANLIQSRTCPRRFRLPELLDTQHMKVVWLSALRTGRLYPSADIPDSLRSCTVLVDSIKSFNCPN